MADTNLPYKLAEVELVYKRQSDLSEMPQIKSSQDAYDIFIRYWDENKIDLVEQCKILLLDRANRVLGISELSTGGVSGTVVDPKIVFATALKAAASAIILAHNHPSRNLKPSERDLIITRDLKDVGKKLTISLHDHLILSPEGFYSMADAWEL